MKNTTILTKGLTKLNNFTDDKALDNPLANGFLANKTDKMALDNWLKHYLSV